MPDRRISNLELVGGDALVVGDEAEAVGAVDEGGAFGRAAGGDVRAAFAGFAGFACFGGEPVEEGGLRGERSGGGGGAEGAEDGAEGYRVLAVPEE